MYYVELLRARRVLTWFAGIVFGLVAVGLVLTLKEGGFHVQMSRDVNPRIPFDMILGVTAFAPLVLAAFIGIGLDAEYKTTAIAWTRPARRISIAGQYVAIDFATMIAAWLIVLAATLIPIAVTGLGKYFSFGGTYGLWLLGLAIGCAVMWYGLILLVAALAPGRGNLIAALSWPIALVAAALSQAPFPHLLHQVIVAVNYVNPLAYLESINSDKPSLIPGSFEAHLVAVWLIGIAAIAIGTQLWARREVPA